ncbi:hypothetical protein IWW40_004562 [Coemansia sp. RSA 1250]|nr:hypothetical protein IWW40_004562 [Coemansia sp. RSA 1250]
MFVQNQEEAQNSTEMPEQNTAHIKYKAIAARPLQPKQTPPVSQPNLTQLSNREGKLQQSSNLATGQAAVNSEQSAAELTSLFSLDADDSLIQELLAGIPSTAWLPTDPLTSEGWFPDPSSSIITQETQPIVSAAGSVTVPVSEQSSAVSRASGTSMVKTLDAASSRLSNATPDARLLASVRSKRETPLISRHNAKRNNPLHGFAKKHGIGYAVGNQMAIISPELLSSSPPKPKQLRQNPYKYYSPPKHLLPRTRGQIKGRNLMLGAKSPLVASSHSQSARSNEADQRKTSTLRERSQTLASDSAGNSRKSCAKWDIGQDKRLIGGVRFQRWKTGPVPRDPDQFAISDWESISKHVNGSGIHRSARQCRRRWAVMYAHLGATIMDFVDSTPTPQSSAHSTPIPPSGLTPRNAEVGKGAAPVPRHVRNLQLAGLPKSSPPLAPVSQPADSQQQLCETNEDQSSDVNRALTEAAPVDLHSLDLEKRWSLPGYCQLLADVVNALSDPDSQAAKVVRKYTAASTDKPDIASQSTGPKSSKANAASSSSDQQLLQLQSALGQQQQPVPIRPHTNPPSGSGILADSQRPPSSGNALSTLVAKSLPISTQQTDALLADTSGQEAAGLASQHPLAIAGSSLTSEALATNTSVRSMRTDLATIDQDMSMYLEFIQSLTKDQVYLGNAWDSLFDASSNTVLPDANATSAALPASSAASGKLAESISVDGKTGSTAFPNKPSEIDDDDANDDDFVLDDNDDEDEDDEDDEELFGKTSATTAPGLVALPESSAADNSWDLTLKQLGLDMPSGSTGIGLQRLDKMPPAVSTSALLSDDLLQKLIQGVTDISGATDAPGIATSNANQPMWMAGANTGILPQWNAATSAEIPLDLQSLQPGKALSTLPRSSAELPASSTKEADKTPVRADRMVGAPTSASSNADVLKGRAVHRPLSHQSQLQKLMSDIVTPAKRGIFKTTRKRRKASSIVKALSAAATIDSDVLSSGEGNGIDTEMSGLYQDALQEGEEIDMQEESLLVDSSDYLFTAEQMAQLREQQLSNFQFVTQTFLISCAKLGPHSQRSRHWKRQLDQLALWHSLGTRESPSDLLSKDGLNKFGDLIASAEQQQNVRSGVVGVSECGRFAPNPASFFAIPGITAVIPDIYEAVDELHRATQLSDSQNPKLESSSKLHRKSGPGAEVRAFDGSMEFTPHCCCTPIRSHEFKAAMMLESVFPRMYLQMHTGKRKAAELAEPADDRAASAMIKRPALLPASMPRAEGTMGCSAGDRAARVKSLAVKAPPRQVHLPSQPPLTALSSSDGAISSASAANSMGLASIVPMATGEGPPAYTQADVRVLVQTMKSQMVKFKHDIHKEPRARQSIFMQGDDGVTRQEFVRRKNTPLVLPMAIQCLLAPLVAHCGFAESLLPQIMVVKKPKNRIHFLETEDALLLLGLRLFGPEDMVSIRVHMLPCKTASQLRNRMNNLRARRARDNPVKEYCLRRIMPFTLEEEETLRMGMMVYGDEFKQLNWNFLVNRPMLALTHVWDHVRNSESKQKNP